MNILIDILLLLVFLLALFGVARQNTAKALVRLVSLALAAGAAMLSPTLAVYASPLFEPAVQRSAVAEFAALAQKPVLSSAEETAEKIDFAALEKAQPEAFAAAARRYGVEPAAVTGAAQQSAGAVAGTLGAPLAAALAQASCMVVLSLLTFLLALGALTALLRRKRKQREKKRITVPSLLLGALAGVVAVAYLVLPLFECFRPYSAGPLGAMQWDQSCAKSALYGVFFWCNPLL